MEEEGKEEGEEQKEEKGQEESKRREEGEEGMMRTETGGEKDMRIFEWMGSLLHIFLASVRTSLHLSPFPVQRCHVVFARP